MMVIILIHQLDTLPVPKAGYYECYMNVNYHNSNNWKNNLLHNNGSLVVHSWNKDIVKFEYLSSTIVQL